MSEEAVGGNLQPDENKQNEVVKKRGNQGIMYNIVTFNRLHFSCTFIDYLQS